MPHFKTLSIQNLHVSVEDKPILRGVNLTINSGEIHALMGPNGSGKSTLSSVIMGHPDYKITQGSIVLDNEDLSNFPVWERARRGVFLAFQYPLEIPGVTVSRFLKRVAEIRWQREHPGERFNTAAFVRTLRSNVEFLEMNWDFVNRYLNEGFSGGEKKRMEILQMLTLEPSLAIMDETDSGLDIDALKVVSKGVNRLTGPDFSALVITHYQRILNYIRPEFVHILYQGRIVTSGGFELVEELENHGYDRIKARFGGDEKTPLEDTNPGKELS
jgi:Fe-S cluster assembly ATP-binding protein